MVRYILVTEETSYLCVKHIAANHHGDRSMRRAGTVLHEINRPQIGLDSPHTFSAASSPVWRCVAGWTAGGSSRRQITNRGGGLISSCSNSGQLDNELRTWLQESHDVVG
jgi:hypothetical protein